MLEQQLLKQLPGCFFIKDKDYKYLYISDYACELIGVNRDDMIGKTDADLVNEAEVTDQWHADDVKVIENGEILENLHDEVVNKNGERVKVLTTKAPYRDDNGEVIGVIGISIINQ